MNFIKSLDYRRGASDLAQRIIQELKLGREVLWLITGGSSIPSSIEALAELKQNLTDLSNLTVTLTDERYGEVGHKDSSWQKLTDSGFDFEFVNAIPVLIGKSFDETAYEWERRVTDALNEADVVIAQFGVGTDMHIAGILPESEGARAAGLVSHYVAGTFDRITLTFDALSRVSSAFVFIFGEAKRGVVDKLRTCDLPPEFMPASILKSIPEVFVYSDNV